MGALTELADEYNHKEGYAIARREYHALQEEYDLKAMDPEDLRELHDKVMSKYEGKEKSMICFNISRELLRFLGIKKHRYFIFYEWTFGDELADSVEQLKQICAATPGLSCVERMSKDSDFFLFHPIEHGPGLQIVDELNRSPPELTRIFQDVECSKLEYPHQLIFKY